MRTSTEKNVLRGQQIVVHKYTSNDSSHYKGHEERVAAHIQRIWNHVCERTGGKKCRDCLYRGKK